MSLTLGDMRDNYVRSNIRRKVDTLSNARVTEFINWAMRRVGRRHTFDEMKKYGDYTVNADDTRVAWPTRMKDLVSMTIQDGSSSTPLDYVFYRFFDEVVPRPESITTTRPYVYVDYGVEWEPFPIPDADYTYTTRHSEYPEPFIDATDDLETSDLVEKDDIIVAFASARGNASIHEFDYSVRWEAIGEKLLREAIKDDKHDPNWLPIARGFSSRPGVLADSHLYPGYGRW